MLNAAVVSFKNVPILGDITQEQIHNIIHRLKEVLFLTKVPGEIHIFQYCRVIFQQS